MKKHTKYLTICIAVSFVEMIKLEYLEEIVLLQAVASLSSDYLLLSFQVTHFLSITSPNSPQRTVTMMYGQIIVLRRSQEPGGTKTVTSPI